MSLLPHLGRKPEQDDPSVRRQPAAAGQFREILAQSQLGQMRGRARGKRLIICCCWVGPVDPKDLRPGLTDRRSRRACIVFVRRQHPNLSAMKGSAGVRETRAKAAVVEPGIAVEDLLAGPDGRAFGFYRPSIRFRRRFQDGVNMEAIRIFACSVATERVAPKTWSLTQSSARSAA